MKKTPIVSLIAIIILGSFIPLLVRPDSLQNPLQHGTLEELAEAIIDFVFNLALVLAPLIIIIGGFYIVTAGGNPEKVKTGKDIIIYALVGILIILTSKGIVAVITSLIN